MFLVKFSAEHAASEFYLEKPPKPKKFGNRWFKSNTWTVKDGKQIKSSKHDVN